MDLFRNKFRRLNKRGPQLSNHAAIFTLILVVYIAAVVTSLIMSGTLLSAVSILGAVLLIVCTFMSAMFVVSRVLKRTDVVDVAWGLASIVAASASFVIGGQSIGMNIQTVALLLVSVWGFRLALSIGMRLRISSEDARYVALRKKWRGNETINTFSRIFILQAVLATILSIAVIQANVSSVESLNGFAYAGIIIWLVGFSFEVIGDMQLKSFLANKANKGKLMTQGLWSYTRHPNYFGEVTMWWGIFVLTLGTTYGWYGIVTPLVITYLLYYVSGVPMTEKSSSKKPGWDSYRQRVSKFIPLPPR